ncbi:MAG: DUF2341 domain-containing protein [Patescibacteria group bacterium]|nr:DUF2341 domain-containing protein [Patescibacteria group bacterium]
MKKYRKTITALSLILAGGLVGATSALASQSDWLNGWDYRTTISVGPIATTTVYYATEITFQGSVSTSTNYIDFSKTLSAGADLRITDSDKITLLPIWIENWDIANKSATVWVRMPQVSSLATSTIYIYYGNSSAPSVSSASSTFDTFYDGFEDYPTEKIDYNPGQWPNTYVNPTYGVNNIVLEASYASTTAWDRYSSTFAHVLKDGDNSYKMYYWGENGSNRGLIGLATSSDGISWSKYLGGPVVGTTTVMGLDEYGLRPPIAWKEGSVYHMLFGSGTSTSYTMFNHATSSDGVVWTRDIANPVFQSNQTGWINSFEACASVIKYDNVYYLYYSGWGDREIGVATSTDLSNWTDYHQAPVFVSSGNPTDRFYNRFCPGVFQYNSKFYLMVPTQMRAGIFTPRIDLYVDSKDPYFLEGDRQFLRTMVFPNPSGPDGLNIDTPEILTDDVTRTATTTGPIYLYYAGQGSSVASCVGSTNGCGRWSTDLIVTPPSILDSLVSPATIPYNMTWRGEGPGSIMVSSDALNGQRSLSIVSTSTMTGFNYTGVNTYFESNIPSGTLEFSIKRTMTNPSAVFNVYLYSTGVSTYASAFGMGTNGHFNISSHSGASVDTGVSYSPNTWYKIKIDFFGSSTAPTLSTFNYSIFNAGGSLLYASSSLLTKGSFAGLGTIRPIMNVPVTQSDSVFLDEFRIRPYSSAEPLTTTGTSTVNVLRGRNMIFKNVTNTVDATDYVAYSSVPAAADLVNLTVGQYSDSVEITVQDWQTSGSYSKQWTASSSLATSTIFTVGDLLPNKSYLVSVDGAGTTTSTTDSSGILTYTYTGGYSTHTFGIEAAPTVESSPAPTPSGTSVSSGSSMSPSARQEFLQKIYADNGLVCPPNLCPTQNTAINNAIKTNSNNSNYLNYAFNTSLKKGNSSDDVRKLQILLNSIGYTVAKNGPGSPGNETDFFGGLTFSAVVRLQKDYGLPTTGYFGPMTRGTVSDILEGIKRVIAK